MTTTTTQHGSTNRSSAASRHGPIPIQGFKTFAAVQSLQDLLRAVHDDAGAVAATLTYGSNDKEVKARLLESIRHAAWRLQDIEVYLEYLFVACLLGTPDETVDVLWCETTVRRCSVCGCTQDDCSGCIEKTGEPCHWVEADLCSACVQEGGS